MKRKQLTEGGAGNFSALLSMILKHKNLSVTELVVSGTQGYRLDVLIELVINRKQCNSFVL